MISNTALILSFESQLDKIADYYLKYYNLQSKDEIHISLMGGDLGVAFFLGYYYILEGRKEVYDLCCQLLGRCIEHVSSNPVEWSFCQGVAGLGWLIQHFSDLGIIDFDDSILDDYDVFLGQKGIHSMQQKNFDFLHGSIGLGIYLLNRKKNEEIDASLNGILNQLIENCISDDLGMRWDTLFKKASQDPDLCDIGMAHGLASIIIFLLRVYKWGLRKEECEEMIYGIIRYLNKSKLPPGSISVFPYKVKGLMEILPDHINSPSPLAWCYGDLGIAFALLHAGIVLNDKELADSSYSIVEIASKRRMVKETFIQDGGLCHGYWGVAYMFSRMYDFSMNRNIQDAAIHWYKKGLEFIDMHCGVHNFKEFNEGKWIDSKSFLTGLSGVGLAMISEVSNGKQNNWEEALLLNIP